MNTTDQPTDHDPVPDSGTDDDSAVPSRFDPASLVAGIVFLGMALTFLLADLDSLEDQVRYVWPASLLALGLGLLLGTRRR